MSESPTFPTPAAFTLWATGQPLEYGSLDPELTIEGDPAVGLHEIVHGGLTVGIWEHGPGVSRDVETDEVFVVVAGRATVAVEDGPTLELVPGSVGVLPAGARTVWTVHEALRKVYVTRGG
jgi:uncharacterized cupin superfamily protein